MDALHNKSSKIPKFRSPNATMSPLMIKLFSSSSSSDSSFNSSSTVEHFSPGSISSKYKGSGGGGKSNNNSPLSVVDDKDVFVMDGILVKDSGESFSSGITSNSNNGFYKAQICRFWRDSGRCAFGAKCQYAHGEVEQRPICSPMYKNKSEAPTCRLYMAGSCVHGSKCRFFHPVPAEARPVSTKGTSYTRLEQAIDTPFSFNVNPECFTRTPATPIPFGFEQRNKNPEFNLKPPQIMNKIVQPTGSSVFNISSKSKDWSPLDDGIEVTLPSQPDKPPSREEIDAYILSFYCPATRRRLPVFIKICPE